ncbi:MAG: class I SAM-dependent methyltransferase [Shinella sp.]|uniref:class I SAM-dependent methyltransferase n=1 Tax=Shinella sp. TaxID=1870904 RepID=UPI003C732AE6
MPAASTSLSSVRSVKADNFTVLTEAFRKQEAKRILDVGCGSGGLAARLIAAGFDVTGVEPRAEAVDAARRIAPKASFVQAAAEALPYAIGPFDAACMVNALHHVPPAEMRNALSRTLAVLRPGGELLVIEPVAGGSFFRCMRPIDDETEVRALAIAAIDGFVAGGGAVLRELRRWDRESRFDGLQGFVDYLLDVDPGRAAAVERRRGELARAWRDNLMIRDGKAVLVQPILCWTLVRPKVD